MLLPPPHQDDKGDKDFFSPLPRFEIDALDHMDFLFRANLLPLRG